MIISSTQGALATKSPFSKGVLGGILSIGRPKAIPSSSQKGLQGSLGIGYYASCVFLCQVVSPSFSKEGLGRIVKVSPQKGLLLAGMPGDGYGGGNWLLREPWARSVTPFPCLPRVSSPPFTKGDLGGLSIFYIYKGFLLGYFVFSLLWPPLGGFENELPHLQACLERCGNLFKIVACRATKRLH